LNPNISPWPLPNFTNVFYNSRLVYDVAIAQYGHSVARLSGEYLSNLLFILLLFVAAFDLLGIIPSIPPSVVITRPGLTEDQREQSRYAFMVMKCVFVLMAWFVIFFVARAIPDDIRAGHSHSSSENLLKNPTKIYSWALNIWFILLFAFAWIVNGFWAVSKKAAE
jgi:hypothetical protein